MQSPPFIPGRCKIAAPFTLLFLCAYNPLFLYIYLLLSPHMTILSKPIWRRKSYIYKCPEPFLLLRLTSFYHSPRFFHSKPWLFCFLFIFSISKKGKEPAKAIAHMREPFAKHGILLFVAIKYSSAKVSIPSLIWCLLSDINLYWLWFPSMTGSITARQPKLLA